MTSIYSDQHERLDTLLNKASDPNGGATLLVPDLQRPYIWTPPQVTLLVDSLIRGWPFGTLLTWRVPASDPARDLARAFWIVVDRRSSPTEDAVPRRHPPADFQMVLDGQQRMQSLLLAFGGDSWGFKLHDADWSATIHGRHPRATSARTGWSLGCLCLDTAEFAAAFARCSRIRSIDFRSVLSWVVTDAATGMSTARATHDRPLPCSSSPETRGRYIRLARLWGIAPTSAGVEEEILSQHAREILNEHDAPTDDAQSVTAVATLLRALAGVKETRVNYLELSQYDRALGDRGSYSDAIVNIFTRLNTAGRTLTREDIMFAWLKTGWDPSSTAQRSAATCVSQLGRDLADRGIDLTPEDIVAALGVAWAVNFKRGELLTNEDLLESEKIKPMAGDVSHNWGRFNEAVTLACDITSGRGLVYQQQFQSANALALIWAWCYAALKWRDERALDLLARDEFEKRVKAALHEHVDRWLIGSQWAGRWSYGSGDVMREYAKQLSSTVATLASTSAVDAACDHLRSHWTQVVAGFQKAAEEHLEQLNIHDRKQARAYFLPLWLWNRLDHERWRAAQIALRETPGKAVAIEVDHVVSWALWQAKIGPVPTTDTPASSDDLSRRAELEAAVNSIGNSLLLEKSFNVSKLDQPAISFFRRVHEFSATPGRLTEWARALDLQDEHLDCSHVAPDRLVGMFEERAMKIRTELKAFIRGERARVDVEVT